MTFVSIVFAFGIFWLQQQASLPDAAVLWACVAAGCGAAAAGIRWRAGFAVAAFLLGYAWAGFMGQWRSDDALAQALEGREVTLVGVIAELPQRLDNGLRFAVDVERAPVGVPQHVSLAWYRTPRHGEPEVAAPLPPLHPGERWQFAVRLKRPHGNLNPHGFDFEAWLFERGIRAVGQIRPGEGNRRLDEFVVAPSYLVERLRQAVRDRFESALAGQRYAGVLIALVIGDQQAIDAPLWRTFAQTGLTHLMSISGLHVTMVAGLAYGLVGWLWRRSAWLPLRLPAQQAAALGGALGALAYCLLAGFAVPAQRTLYMLAVVALALWSRRQVGAATVLSFALVVVLLLDPWAVVSAGFWLSFGAVALLLYIGAGRVGRPHWLRDWLRAQWAVTVGMVPALLALFQQFSLVSPLANAIAIPMVSLVVTPLALAGAVLPGPFCGWLLAVAHGLMAALMVWVDWLANLPAAVWQQHAPPVWALLAGTAGAVWLLLPRGVPARWLGLVLMAPLVLLPAERPSVGEAKVVVLDVGQGLAVHVQTAGHDLLYDTGPMYSPEANSGLRIILPYLRAVGVARLDTLVVTHQDTDHSGGAASLLETLPVGQMLDSLPFEHDLAAAPVPHADCRDGQAWEWDGVRFEMLYPPDAQYDDLPRKTNDMSCVLKISAGGHSMLLTSDIEALSEERLLTRRRADLHSDVLLVPHHGSRTSSTPAFIAAVGAATAVFPVGYLNRFHHPHPEVWARHQASGARLLRTDGDGAVTLRLAATGVSIERERALQRRYWHGR